jgi:hypothetical protein
MTSLEGFEYRRTEQLLQVTGPELLIAIDRESP